MLCRIRMVPMQRGKHVQDLQIIRLPRGIMSWILRVHMMRNVHTIYIMCPEKIFRWLSRNQRYVRGVTSLDIEIISTSYQKLPFYLLVTRVDDRNFDVESKSFRPPSLGIHVVLPSIRWLTPNYRDTCIDWFFVCRFCVSIWYRFGFSCIDIGYRIRFPFVIRYPLLVVKVNNN